MLMNIKGWLSENRIFIIALLSLLVAFSGITLNSIVFFFNSLWRPQPPNYVVTSADTPSTLDIRLPLSVSDRYYIVTYVRIAKNR